MMPKCTIAVLWFSSVIALGQNDPDLRTKYQNDLAASPRSSITQFRLAELYFQQHSLQSAANTFRAALTGDLNPKWVEVWSHIKLGNIFDITGQRERALNEYRLAQETKDNTRGAQDEVGIYLEYPYPHF